MHSTGKLASSPRTKQELAQNKNKEKPKKHHQPPLPPKKTPKPKQKQTLKCV